MIIIILVNRNRSATDTVFTINEESPSSNPARGAEQGAGPNGTLETWRAASRPAETMGRVCNLDARPSN